MRSSTRHNPDFGAPKAGARSRCALAALLALVAAVAAVAPSSRAQTGNYRGYAPGDYQKGVNELPEALENLDVVEKRGAPLPLDAVLTDSEGNRGELRDFLEPGKPVLLNLVYFECPMLCGLVMADTTRALRESRWDVGEDYTVLTISFDHTNSIAQAAGKKAEYADAVRRDGVKDGWKFFVTTEADARRIADSVGFPFRRLPSGEFAHPSVQMVLTPEGAVSTYLYGLYGRDEAGSSFTKQQLELSLQDAADGKLGGIFDRISFFCYVHTDQGYAFSAYRFMQLMGGVTVVLVAGFLVVMFRADRRRRAKRSPSGQGPVGVPDPATA